MDRDGVVNEQIVDGYVMCPEQFVFIDGTVEALRKLRSCFDKIILVTNQQCVGKGLCSMEHINRVHEWMNQQLQAQGFTFDKIYCCPHLAAEHCECRKPQPGMAWHAKQDFPDIEFSQSVMLGDALSDMQFAQNAGMRAVHIGTIRHPEFEQIKKITTLHYDSLKSFSEAITDCR